MHVAGGESRCILLPTMCAPVKEASTAHSYSQAQALRPRGVIKRRDRGTGGLHNTLTTTAQQINHFVEPDQWPRSINIKLAHQDQAKRTFSLAVVARSHFAVFRILKLAGIVRKHSVSKVEKTVFSCGISYFFG